MVYLPTCGKQIHKNCDYGTGSAKHYLTNVIIDTKLIEDLYRGKLLGIFWTNENFPDIKAYIPTA